MNEDTATSSLEWLTPTAVRKTIVGYVVAWMVYGVVVYALGGLTKGGLFGDMFGAFNALVSGLAMLGVVGAILLQRDQNRMQAEELHLQRQELADTREELKGQREALEVQNVHAQTQAEVAQNQLGRWDKDYLERNRPVVFCDRREEREIGDNLQYVIRNVGGGFAVNVYFIDADDSPDVPPLALGSLAPNTERQVPLKVNEALVNSASGVRHILIAEGLFLEQVNGRRHLTFARPNSTCSKGKFCIESLSFESPLLVASRRHCECFLRTTGRSASTVEHVCRPRRIVKNLSKRSVACLELTHLAFIRCAFGASVPTCVHVLAEWRGGALLIVRLRPEPVAPSRD